MTLKDDMKRELERKQRDDVVREAAAREREAAALAWSEEFREWVKATLLPSVEEFREGLQEVQYGLTTSGDWSKDLRLRVAIPGTDRSIEYIGEPRDQRVTVSVMLHSPEVVTQGHTL